MLDLDRRPEPGRESGGEDRGDGDRDSEESGSVGVGDGSGDSVCVPSTVPLRACLASVVDASRRRHDRVSLNERVPKGLIWVAIVGRQEKEIMGVEQKKKAAADVLGHCDRR